MTFTGEAKRLTPQKETYCLSTRQPKCNSRGRNSSPKRNVPATIHPTVGWSKSSDDGQSCFRQCPLLFLLWQQFVEQNIAKNTTEHFPSFLYFYCCPDHVLPKSMYCSLLLPTCVEVICSHVSKVLASKNLTAFL